VLPRSKKKFNVIIGCASRGRVPALQVPGPEFNPNDHQKKKKKKKEFAGFGAPLLLRNQFESQANKEWNELYGSLDLGSQGQGS
jgi:hypothetical protein